MTTEASRAGDRPDASSLLEPAPRRRHRWTAVAAAALMVPVLLVATAAGFRFVQSDPLPATTDGPVIAVDFDADDGWPTAEVSGTLRLQEGCLLVDDRLALFPEGTTWSEPDQVIFRDGERWTVGQQIEGGGGSYSTDTVTRSDLGGEAAAASASSCVDALGLAGSDSLVLVAP